MGRFGKMILNIWNDNFVFVHRLLKEEIYEFEKL